MLESTRRSGLPQHVIRAVGGEASDDALDIAAVERGRDRPHQLDRHHRDLPV